MENPKMRSEFKPEFYVGRTEEFERVRQWKQGSKRALTITAPPATGKTWFLKHIEKTLQEDDKEAVLLIGADAVFTKGEDEKWPEDTKLPVEWLNSRLEELNNKSFTKYDPNHQFTAYVTQIAREVVAKCGEGKSIWVIVDGGDELPKHIWAAVEKHVIEPLSRARQLRFIIALREEYRLQVTALRWSEERMELRPIGEINDDLSTHGGRKQLELLSNVEPRQYGSVDAVGELLPEYDFSHAGLNTFLSQVAAQPEYGGDLLKGALAALLPERSTPLEKAKWLPKVAKWLQIVSELDGPWTLGDLVDECERRGEEINETAAWSWMQKLQDYYCIKVADDSGPSFRVPTGLHNFVRAYNKKIGGENE